MSFDIHILPISKKDGKDASDQVGVYLASPTSKTIRSRKGDVILFYLTMSNPRNFPQAKQILLFKKLAEHYYQQKESISSSLSAMIEYSNRYFLNQNIQNESVANFLTGNMTIAIFKEDKIYVIQAGKAISFICQGEGFSQKHTVTENVNLLGMKQGIEPFFYINEFDENSNIILAHEVSSNWDKNSFRYLGSQSLISAQQRLAPENILSANFILIKPSQGKGFIQLIQSKLKDDLNAPMVSQNSISEKLEDTKPIVINTHESQENKEQFEYLPISQIQAIELTDKNILSSGFSEEINYSSELSDETKSNEKYDEYDQEELEFGYSQNQRATKIKREKRLPKQVAKEIIYKIKNIFDTIYFASQKVLSPIKGYIDQHKPETSFFDFSVPWKLGITIGVPILLSIAGLFVAMNTGAELVFQQKLAEAKNQYIIAENTQNLTQRKEAYKKSIQMFDEALKYGNNEIDNLNSNYNIAKNQRNSIQNTLDELNNVKRVDFYPLLESTFDNDVNITKIVNTDTEIFLLDSKSGEVYLITPQTDGYQLEDAFKCSNIEYDEASMNPIIDIAEYPGNGNADPALVAIDNKGVILYCFTGGQRPIAEKVEKPPLGFGNTTEVEVKNNNIYLLDKAANAVWFYSLEELRKSQDQNPDFSPTFYFSENVPNLSSVQDFTINGNNLFAFYSDQHIALCLYQIEYNGGFITTTMCQDPATFDDTRNEISQTQTILGSNFDQITSTPSPEPSVFLADFSTKQIFQFSQSLRLNQVYEPQSNFTDEKATAFDVSPGYKPYRTIVMAFGNELYIAKVE